MLDRAHNNDTFTLQDRARVRRDHAYTINLCFNATMALARASGASSLFESHPMQRFVRDTHAGSMQAALGWDEQAESYGRTQMGLEPNGHFV